MCGRVAAIRGPRQLARMTGARYIPSANAPSGPRYNVGPMQAVPILYQRGANPNNSTNPNQQHQNNQQPQQHTQQQNSSHQQQQSQLPRRSSELVVEYMTWGLVGPNPTGAANLGNDSNGPYFQHNIRTDNPRLNERNFQHSRCLFLLDGFYEWDTMGGTGFPGLGVPPSAPGLCSSSNVDSDTTANPSHQATPVGPPPVLVQDESPARAHMRPAYFVRSNHHLTKTYDYYKALAPLSGVSIHQDTVTDEAKQQEPSQPSQHEVTIPNDATTPNATNTTSHANVSNPPHTVPLSQLDPTSAYANVITSPEEGLDDTVLSLPSADPKCPIDITERPLLYVAGVYSWYNDRLTVGMLTTSSNSNMSWMHDRMPLILTPEQARAWVDTEGVSWRSVDVPSLSQPSSSSSSSSSTATSSATSSSPSPSIAAPSLSSAAPLHPSSSSTQSSLPLSPSSTSSSPPSTTPTSPAPTASTGLPRSSRGSVIYNIIHTQPNAETHPLTWHRVSNTVNSIRNKGPECLMELNEFKAIKLSKGIGRFFSGGTTATGNGGTEGKGGDNDDDWGRYNNDGPVEGKGEGSEEVEVGKVRKTMDSSVDGDNNGQTNDGNGKVAKRVKKVGGVGSGSNGTTLDPFSDLVSPFDEDSDNKAKGKSEGGDGAQTTKPTSAAKPSYGSGSDSFKSPKKGGKGALSGTSPRKTHGNTTTETQSPHTLRSFLVKFNKK